MLSQQIGRVIEKSCELRLNQHELCDRQGKCNRDRLVDANKHCSYTNVKENRVQHSHIHMYNIDTFNRIYVLVHVPFTLSFFKWHCQLCRCNILTLSRSFSLFNIYIFARAQSRLALRKHLWLICTTATFTDRSKCLYFYKSIYPHKMIRIFFLHYLKFH